MADITSLLPTSGALLTDLTFEEAPSLTYAMHVEDQSIYDYTDGLNCIRQAVYKILRTERYTYPVYSWDYGIELIDLFGKPTPYVEVELKRRIREALEWDDRINKVDSFVFSYPNDKNEIHVQFEVHTTLGTIESDFEFSKIDESTVKAEPRWTYDDHALVASWRATVKITGRTMCLDSATEQHVDGTTLVFED